MNTTTQPAPAIKNDAADMPTTLGLLNSNPPLKIQDIQMSDIVGNYDTPDEVSEWAWIEQNASYAHLKNGESGIWEFFLNLSLRFSDVPDSLAPSIDQARKDQISYILFHQGT